MTGKSLILATMFALISSEASAICPYDANCLNNPYGGRSMGRANNDLGSFAPGPYSSNGQYGLGSAFGNNPLTREPRSNPFLPETSADELKKAQTQGINPDQQSTSLPTVGGNLNSGPLQGVDPDQQR